jgi:DNA-binding CsgD family transcriptional regulator
MGTGDLRSNEFHLTSRQVEVLDLLARGRTNPQIAEALGISLPGAKWHVSEVMNKLGAASREEAVAAWREHQREGSAAGGGPQVFAAGDRSRDNRHRDCRRGRCAQRNRTGAGTT